MPPIPKLNKQNRNELKSSKDFIQENINKIRNSFPLCPRRYIVSDRKGNKFLIDGSGLQKDFIHKKVIRLVFIRQKSFPFIWKELRSNPIVSSNI
jgi:hypothetical protein